MLKRMQSHLPERAISSSATEAERTNIFTISTLQATLTNSSVPPWGNGPGRTFHGFRIQTWMLNLVCVRLFLLSIARSQEWSNGVPTSGSKPSVENAPGPERELGVETPQFWRHLWNCPDLRGVHTALASYSSCSKL